MQTKAEFLKEDAVRQEQARLEAVRVAKEQTDYAEALNAVPSTTVYRFIRLILHGFKPKPGGKYYLLGVIREKGNRAMYSGDHPFSLNYLYFDRQLEPEFTFPEKRILHMALAEFKREAEAAGWRVIVNYPNLTVEFMV